MSEAMSLSGWLKVLSPARVCREIRNPEIATSGDEIMSKKGMVTLTWFLEEVWESLLVTSVLLIAGWVYNWMDEKTDVGGHGGWRRWNGYCGTMWRAVGGRCELLEWETKNRQSVNQKSNQAQEISRPRHTSLSQAPTAFLLYYVNRMPREQKYEEFKSECWLRAMFIELQPTIPASTAL